MGNPPRAKTRRRESLSCLNGLGDSLCGALGVKTGGPPSPPASWNRAEQNRRSSAGVEKRVRFPYRFGSSGAKGREEKHAPPLLRVERHGDCTGLKVHSPPNSRDLLEAS